jgi:hypothetical protein
MYVQSERLVVKRIKRFIQGRQWRLKQRVAAPGRYYGDGGTIHSTGYVDVGVDSNGQVVSVWFRCQPLPFRQTDCGKGRADEMRRMYSEAPMPDITGVELVDPK